jgi:hypothetical protein
LVLCAANVQQPGVQPARPVMPHRRAFFSTKRN